MEHDYLDKRVQRSKAALKQTFLQILQQKPFEQITVSEVAREANYNRGTFYANFESMEQLLDEVLKDTLNEMIKQIKTPYMTSKKVNMRSLQVEDITLFSYFKENARLYKLLLSRHLSVDFRYQMAKAIEQLFVKEYEYEYVNSVDLSPKWFYIYRAHGIAGLIIRWIEEDFPESPSYMSEQIIELMVASTEVFHVKKTNGGDKGKGGLHESF
ncbi:transcriptional regulator [Bacillus sp. TS-2]|nr:transcriptional regulator [Bacillus sp. TS-2]